MHVWIGDILRRARGTTVVLLGPAPDPVALRGCRTVASDGYSAQQSYGAWGWPQQQSSSSFSGDLVHSELY
jgi:hypothetical protein